MILFECSLFGSPLYLLSMFQAPWSADEQKLLEGALKTFPATLGTERWDKIADSIPNRSKKDCMRRYKELAEVVRAKKAAAAQAAAAAKK